MSHTSVKQCDEIFNILFMHLKKLITTTLVAKREDGWPLSPTWDPIIKIIMSKT